MFNKTVIITMTLFAGHCNLIKVDKTQPIVMTRYDEAHAWINQTALNSLLSIEPFRSVGLRLFSGILAYLTDVIDAKLNMSSCAHKQSEAQWSVKYGERIWKALLIDANNKKLCIAKAVDDVDTIVGNYYIASENCTRIDCYESNLTKNNVDTGN